MKKVDLNRLLDDFNNGREEVNYYYIIGMWLVTNSYNKNGYIIDIIVCKGENHLEAIDEAKEYQHKIRKIEDEKYVPLTIGKTVLEATKNSSYFNNLLWNEEVMPDDEKVKNAFDLVLKKEKEWNVRYQ